MKNASICRVALCVAGAPVLAMGIAAPSMAEVSANVSVANNYIWRGLTQSINEVVVQGGIDYAHDSGFYTGTWLSNVAYDSDDAFSYEHNLYLGYAGETRLFSYDVGYLYYNYDDNANADFSEVYGSIGIGKFSASLSLLADTEVEEAPGKDFGFGDAVYLSLDYSLPLTSGTEVDFHVGHHNGDFVNAFNGVGSDYSDWHIRVSRDGFAFMISGTDLGWDDDGDGIEDYASMPARDNDEIKFTVSYSIDFEL